MQSLRKHLQTKGGGSTGRRACSLLEGSPFRWRVLGYLLR
jgi:hypothetical protein